LRAAAAVSNRSVSEFILESASPAPMKRWPIGVPLA
jgi:uncharacterized protein (DUF1778 family)